MGCCGSIKKDLESEILQLKTHNIELTEQHSNLKKECNSHKHKLKELSINSANQLEKSLSMINTHKLKLQGKVQELSNVNSLVSKLKSELEDIKEDNMTLIEEKEITLPIQIKGKLISTINTKKGYNERDLLEQIYKIEKISNKIAGKKIVRVINVQDKIINIITN